MMPKQDFCQSTSVAKLPWKSHIGGISQMEYKNLIFISLDVEFCCWHRRIHNLINSVITEGKIILRAVTPLFAHKVPLYFPSFFLNGLEIDGRGWRFNEIFEVLLLKAQPFECHLSDTPFSSGKGLINIFMLVKHLEGTRLHVSICYGWEGLCECMMVIYLLVLQSPASECMGGKSGRYWKMSHFYQVWHIMFRAQSIKETDDRSSLLCVVYQMSLPLTLSEYKLHPVSVITPVQKARQTSSLLTAAWFTLRVISHVLQLISLQPFLLYWYFNWKPVVANIQRNFGKWGKEGQKQLFLLKAVEKQSCLL